MSKLTIVFSDANRAVTVVGVNGNRVDRRAAGTLNVSHRKDGGVTIWGDGEHRDQTVRVDAYGRVMNGRKSFK